MPRFNGSGNPEHDTFLYQPTPETHIQSGLLPQILDHDSDPRTLPAIQRRISRMPDIPRRRKGIIPLPELLSSQTPGPSANSSEPSIELNNVLGLSLASSRTGIMDIRSPIQISEATSSRPTIKPNNALGLSLDSPQSSNDVESFQISTPVPLGFRSFWDEGRPLTNSKIDIFGETAVPTIGLNNGGLLPLIQRCDSDSRTYQDIGQGSSRMPNIPTRSFIPNPTLWRIPVPPPGPLLSNFDPFKEDSLTAGPSANSSQPAIEPNNALAFSLDSRQTVEAEFDYVYEAIAYSNPSDHPTSVNPSQLLRERLPKKHELCVKFGGKLGHQVGWNDVEPAVDQFIACTSSETYTHHKLTVIWEASSSGFDRWVCGRTLKQLFDRLKEPVANGGVLSAFDRISICVPEKVEEADIFSVPWPGNIIAEQRVHDVDRIDLGPASSLKTFLWKGSFQCFAERFSYIPADYLKNLSITGCHISLNDAIALLQPCSSLEEVQLETIHHTKDCESGNLFTLKPGIGIKSGLKELLITSSVDLSLLFQAMKRSLRPISLTVTFLDNGRQDTNAVSCTRTAPKNAVLTLKGKFLTNTMDTIRGERPGTLLT